MAKKKKEHITFDRMAEERIKINKKAFIQNQKRTKNFIKTVQDSNKSISNKGMIIMDKKIKEILADAYFIGGSPCSGKSSIAGILAEKCNVFYYNIDSYEEKHVKQSNPDKQPVMYNFSTMTWDEIWMRSVNLQVDEEFEFYWERFPMILNELKTFNTDKPVILEGAALLPELISKLNIDERKVIYMVPSKEFQVKYYSEREFKNVILAQCKHPDQAFANWMERDHRFGKKVAHEAKKLGMRVIHVDGRCSLKENYKLVKEHFGL